jgi:hypothetical protein
VLEVVLKLLVVVDRVLNELVVVDSVEYVLDVVL